MDKLIVNEKDNRLFIRIIKTFVLFGTVFSLHPKWGLPSYITPRIIIMMLCVLFFFFRWYKNKLKFVLSRRSFLFIVTNSVIYIYSYVIIWIHNVESELTITSSIFNFLVFVVFFAYLANYLFHTSEEFCTCMLDAAFIQALIVLLGVFSPQIRELLDSFQSYGEDAIFQGYRYTWRVVGFGIAGAGGSVYLFTGMIAAGWLKIKGNMGKIQFLKMCILSISILLVGRTGFYCVLALLCYFIYDDIRFKNGSMKTVLGLFVMIFIGVCIYILFTDNQNVNKALITYTLERSMELFVNGTETLSKVLKVPPLRIETIFGTGITRGMTSTGLYIWSDSGYIQRYAAIGIVMTVISYYSYIVQVIGYINRQRKRLRIYLFYVLALLFIIELKEPFIYQLAYPFVLLVLVRLSYRESRQVAIG